jgi:hypothetical protein
MLRQRGPARLGEANAVASAEVAGEVTMGVAQSGWGNVAVTVDGDCNTVTVTCGGAELVLFQRHKRLR